MTFTDLGLNTPSGSWTVPSTADAIEMVGPNNSVEAVPSVINGSAQLADFTVTDMASGGSTPAATRSAMKRPQSTFVALAPRAATGTAQR